MEHANSARTPPGGAIDACADTDDSADTLKSWVWKGLIVVRVNTAGACKRRIEKILFTLSWFTQQPDLNGSIDEASKKQPSYLFSRSWPQCCPQ